MSCYFDEEDVDFIAFICRGDEEDFDFIAFICRGDEEDFFDFSCCNLICNLRFAAPMAWDFLTMAIFAIFSLCTAFLIAHWALSRARMA